MSLFTRLAAVFRPARWLYPGIGVKRWIFLGLLALVVLLVAVSGFMGDQLFHFRVDVVPERTLRAFTDHVRRLKFVDFLLVGLGAWGIVLCVRRLVRNVAALGPTDLPDAPVLERLVRRAQLAKGPRIVAIGGGTGLPQLLLGLKEHTSNLSAIVTVADDGGSSGRLRSGLNMPAPGDVRNCLVALADTSPLMERLFLHRFRAESPEIGGHAFGNLFLAAMADVTGDFGRAIEESSRVLAIRGRVIPMTRQNVTLQAVLADGTVVRGESAIGRSVGPIDRVTLEPAHVAPPEEALEAIREADAIVLGPGSLFTSVIPNLLISGIAEAIAASRAQRIYVCNIMTQPGETIGFVGSDHVRAIFRHAGRPVLDYALFNSEPIPPALAGRYAVDGAGPVVCDEAALRSLGVRPVVRRFLAAGDFVRHDSRRLARAILRLVVV